MGVELGVAQKEVPPKQQLGTTATIPLQLQASELGS